MCIRDRLVSHRESFEKAQEIFEVAAVDYDPNDGLVLCEKGYIKGAITF